MNFKYLFSESDLFPINIKLIYSFPKSMHDYIQDSQFKKLYLLVIS